MGGIPLRRGKLIAGNYFLHVKKAQSLHLLRFYLLFYNQHRTAQERSKTYFRHLPQHLNITKQVKNEDVAVGFS